MQVQSKVPSCISIFIGGKRISFRDEMTVECGASIRYEPSFSLNYYTFSNHILSSSILCIAYNAESRLLTEHQYILTTRSLLSMLMNQWLYFTIVISTENGEMLEKKLPLDQRQAMLHWLITVCRRAIQLI